MSEEIVLECRGIRHSFGSKNVLHDINMKVIRGEIVSLVGPSGCGKSTLLRSIVGTHQPTHGDILVMGRDDAVPSVVEGPGRDRGIVYQQYSLFPFLTAQENVAVGLMLDQTSLLYRIYRYPSWRKIRKRHLEEAAEMLAKLKLGDAITLYPHQMSGGMRQRVAVAQALIMKPEVLLLDEPFGALDEATREELQRMLLTLYLENCQAKQRGKKPPYTIVIVTHEINEAIYVGDRVVAISQYWNWKDEGFSAFPGATVVYDQVTPVFAPDAERDFSTFTKQRKEIRYAAFDPTVIKEREEFQRFWDQVRSGDGRGVLS